MKQEVEVEETNTNNNSNNSDDPTTQQEERNEISENILNDDVLMVDEYEEEEEEESKSLSIPVKQWDESYYQQIAASKYSKKRIIGSQNPSQPMSGI
eukprot:CAMPEP_0182429402 /NCGR_PEP_ID=MMETSP1167-20130531/28093_1 /TAXON_ID=2988 /ORGANISM="Mallomonas Sp, Strain CCMP3275" /LENGTH=96 /DNA_ID=CAMNT_0024613037 /DNA_START=339 /DNA_END=626 /DNA_ORIENTATION=-